MMPIRLWLCVPFAIHGAIACTVSGQEPIEVSPVEPLGYAYQDNVPRSVAPPGGLAPEQVPQFIVISSDDNGAVSGLEWLLGLPNGRINPSGRGNTATHDGSPLTMTLYVTTSYINEAGPLWRWAYHHGHELGNHSQTHGSYLTKSQRTTNDWLVEYETCTRNLADLGIPRTALYGVRAPFLSSSDEMLEAVRYLGFWYDASVEEGFETGQDGTRLAWPYTLDEGSYGNQVLVGVGVKRPIKRYPGVWELPCYAVTVPPDEHAESYGATAGLRAALGASPSGQLTGLDYNLWYRHGTTPEQFLITLKYSLDQRLKGNRAPFIFTLHSQYYTDAFPERRAAVEAFIDYALLQPAVRFVSMKKLLDWLRAPVPLTP